MGAGEMKVGTAIKETGTKSDKSAKSGKTVSRATRTASRRVAGSTAKTSKAAAQSRKSAKPELSVSELILEHRENGRKLARSILRKWRVRMPAEEIDSIVDLALCEAAARFDATKGASFMTFLFYHLRGHLVRGVSKAAQSSNIFLAFAQGMGLEQEDWKHISGDVIWSYLPDNVLGQRESKTPESVVLRKEKIDKCREAVSSLDALEREVISRSFGTEQPLVDIAKTLGYSRCHVSRVKKAALERLEGMLEHTRAGDGKSASESTKAPSRRSRRRRLPKSLKSKTLGGLAMENKIKTA